MKIGEKLKNINFIIGENEVIKSTQLLGKKQLFIFIQKRIPQVAQKRQLTLAHIKESLKN